MASASSSPHTASASFPFEAPFLPLALAFTEQASRAFGFGQREFSGLVLAVEEIYSGYLDQLHGSAGIDLVLALIADDHGTDLAHEISKEMVVLSRRMEGHPQISAAARTPRPKHAELERLMATVSADPASKLVTVQGGGDFASIGTVIAAAGYTPAAVPAR